MPTNDGRAAPNGGDAAAEALVAHQKADLLDAPDASNSSDAAAASSAFDVPVTTAADGKSLPAASAWVVRWSHLVAKGARVLDVACGSGRHVHWFEGRGCRVTGVDRDRSAVEPLQRIADIVVADLEAGSWPFADGKTFDAVVVTNYLWRPLLPSLVASVAAGGCLIYETFAVGQQVIGRPSNPDFLLEPGELLVAVAGLRIIAFEDGFVDAAAAQPARFVQRIVAVREASPVTGHSPPPHRYLLG